MAYGSPRTVDEKVHNMIYYDTGKKYLHDESCRVKNKERGGLSFEAT